MEIKEYIEFTRTVSVYPNVGNNLNYCIYGLIEEYGELTGKIKKLIRDSNGEFTPEWRNSVVKEIGDVVFYLFRIVDEIDFQDFIINQLSLQDLISTQSTKTIFKNINELTAIPLAIKDGNKEIAKIIDHSENILFFKNKPLDILVNPENEFYYNKEILLNGYYRFINILNSLSSLLTNISLSEVIRINVEKLSSRKERNVLNGSGDNR